MATHAHSLPFPFHVDVINVWPPMLSGVLQKQLLKKLLFIISISHLYPKILLKHEQKCFSTAFTNLLVSCIVEYLPVAVSKTYE